MWLDVAGWTYGRFIAEAACSIVHVSPVIDDYFRIEMSCTHKAGDLFDSSQPIVLSIRNETRVLPSRLMAGEPFGLRLAEINPEAESSDGIWLTMRSAVDGALLFSLSRGRWYLPDPDLLDRLSLGADQWLAPLVVESVTGVCPAVPDVWERGTEERAAVDITVPDHARVRLVDRYTAYLADTYLVELGTWSYYTQPDFPKAWPHHELMLAAIDSCAE